MCSNNNNNAVSNKCSRNTATIDFEGRSESWLKIECSRGCNARQCYKELQEACDECALPYRTVARWVKAFKEGRPIILHEKARVDAAGAVTDLLNRWGLESALPLLLFSRFKPLRL